MRVLVRGACVGASSFTSQCRHTTTQSPTAAARTQLIDVRRALEVLGVTQLRRPRPAGFRRSATSHGPKVVASQRGRPSAACGDAAARVNRLEKKSGGASKKNLKTFLPPLLTPPTGYVHTTHHVFVYSLLTPCRASRTPYTQADKVDLKTSHQFIHVHCRDQILRGVS